MGGKKILSVPKVGRGLPLISQRDVRRAWVILLPLKVVRG
jgi:hypothetical protein